MPPPTDRLFTQAEALLASITDFWPDDAEPLPGRFYVNDGQVPWDCEQLTVNVERLFHTEGDLSLEAIGLGAGPGMFMRAAVFAITLVRCSPMPTNQGAKVVNPTPAQIEVSSSRVLRDAMAVFGAAVEAFKAGQLPGCNQLAFDSWQAEGPEGGFAGGTTRLRILML